MPLLCVVIAVGLTSLFFTADRQGRNDESRVLQTRGTVVEEVRSSTGSCKGADFDTRIEWTQDDDLRTAWTNTCRSGPDVGDRVDVWVRDDGEITLRAPSTTVVILVLGSLFFLGMGALCCFSVRFGLRKVDRQLAAL